MRKPSCPPGVSHPPDVWLLHSSAIGPEREPRGADPSTAIHSSPATSRRDSRAPEHSSDARCSLPRTMTISICDRSNCVTASAGVSSVPRNRDEVGDSARPNPAFTIIQEKNRCRVFRDHPVDQVRGCAPSSWAAWISSRRLPLRRERGIASQRDLSMLPRTGHSELCPGRIDWKWGTRPELRRALPAMRVRLPKTRRRERGPSGDSVHRFGRAQIPRRGNARRSLLRRE